MGSLAHDGARTELVRNATLQLCRHPYGLTCADLARSIETVIRGQVIFVPEYQERIQTPERLLKEIASRGIAYGDCDDAATLAAAMLLSVGIQDLRFVAMRYGDVDYFEHVILEVACNGEWKRIDPTVDRRTFYGNVSERMEVYL